MLECRPPGLCALQARKGSLQIKYASLDGHPQRLFCNVPASFRALLLHFMLS